MLPEETGHLLIGQTKLSYAIRRSRRRRSIGLLVGREGEIRILAPARAGLAAIERLIHRHTDWIGRRLDHAARLRALRPEMRFAAGESVPYRGENFTLRVTEIRGEPQGCAIEGDALIVNLHAAARDAGAQREEIRLEVMLWYKREARQIFRQRADYWSALTGLRYRRLAVGNARRQWGSCSAGDDVRLNWRLILASPPLLDYVIVHELAHIRHKNHSRRFWNLAESILPDCKALRKRLRALDPAYPSA